MQLSKRLLTIADMVTRGNRVVDVGTDHGYIPIYLVKNKQIPSAIAMDIRSGPLERAKGNIQKENLEEYIETRLSDGVHALQAQEADTMIIAGMGGGLVKKIMEEGQEVLKTMKEYILQPQSEIDMVRKYLEQEGYIIEDERMVLEEGKFYPIMRVYQGIMKYEREIYYRYGKILLEEKNDILYLFLKKELNTYINLEGQLASSGGENATIRLEEIRKEIVYIEEALAFYI
jgi:Predicted SAM-dependent methyltransferase